MGVSHAAVPVDGTPGGCPVKRDTWKGPLHWVRWRESQIGGPQDGDPWWGELEVLPWIVYPAGGPMESVRRGVPLGVPRLLPLSGTMEGVPWNGATKRGHLGAVQLRGSHGGGNLEGVPCNGAPAGPLEGISWWAYPVRDSMEGVS